MRLWFSFIIENNSFTMKMKERCWFTSKIPDINSIFLCFFIRTANCRRLFFHKFFWWKRKALNTCGCYKYFICHRIGPRKIRLSLCLQIKHASLLLLNWKQRLTVSWFHRITIPFRLRIPYINYTQCEVPNYIDACNQF